MDPAGAGRAADAALVLYARVPRAGQVKTRMIPCLGEHGALGLHLALLEDSLCLLRTAARATGAEPFVAFSEDWEPGREDGTTSLADAARGLSRLPQSGGDLGDRLLETFGQLAARGCGRVVVFGSDCPALQVAGLREAFDRLLFGADVVLGPAEDGGYYLVGASRPVTEIFRDIPWGTPGVLQATLSAAGTAAARVALLPRSYDLDVPADLLRLRDELSGAGGSAACGARTREFVRTIVREARPPRCPSPG